MNSDSWSLEFNKLVNVAFSSAQSMPVFNSKSCSVAVKVSNASGFSTLKLGTESDVDILSAENH